MRLFALLALALSCSGCSSWEAFKASARPLDESNYTPGDVRPKDSDCVGNSTYAVCAKKKDEANSAYVCTQNADGSQTCRPRRK
jgi:hypothetical protein